ncbi:MAG TPA: glycosyltransferase family 2 protein, partial [Kiloniellales bacterium]|nr:glycosyltransferase family 2 protein [Kiloniellales bacterium]
MSVQRNAAAQAWLGAARALLDDPVSAEARAWLAAATGLPDGAFPPAPEGLVARPAPEPPALHHARRLQALAAVDSDPLEVAWHARWLAYALAPDDPANRPRVSVVIPVYNRRNQVVEAVRSVLEQDWPATEVVVVDDGSTDDPESMLAPWRARIVFRRLPQNGGVSVARNAALALATGELV